MSLSRIVLDPSVREIADAIQEKTRSTSPSAVITLMLTRYGRHMLETWELTGDRCVKPQSEQPTPSVATSPALTATPQNLPAEFTFSKAIDL